MSTWIYRIALNVSISHLRKSKRKEEHLPLIETLTYEIEESDENIILLQQFIRELNEIDRAIIILFLDDFGHEEIAKVMGITTTNVSTKIHRIKKQLAKKFKK